MFHVKNERHFHTVAKKAKLNLCCIVVYYGSTFTKEGLKIDTMLLAFGEGKKGRSSSHPKTILKFVLFRLKPFFSKKPTKLTTKTTAWLSQDFHYYERVSELGRRPETSTKAFLLETQVWWSN